MQVEKHHTEAGGGPFDLPDVTIGILHDDQPDHRLSVGGDRRTHLPLVVGQGWLMPAGAVGRCEYDAPLDYVTVSLPEALLRESAPGASTSFAPRVGALDPLLLQLAGTLSELDASGGVRLYRESLERALAAHVGYLLAPAAPTAVGALDDARLRRALDYVHDRLADDLSLEALAREATMSVSQFARAFRAATGRSPLQYVIDERIALAKVLLRTTALPIARVGWRTGHRDAAHFSRQFRRRVGCTPREFRSASFVR